jgi:hypothetical protein
LPYPSCVMVEIEVCCLILGWVQRVECNLGIVWYEKEGRTIKQLDGNIAWIFHESGAT